MIKNRLSFTFSIILLIFFSVSSSLQAEVRTDFQDSTPDKEEQSSAQDHAPQLTEAMPVSAPTYTDFHPFAGPIIELLILDSSQEVYYQGQPSRRSKTSSILFSRIISPNAP